MYYHKKQHSSTIRRRKGTGIISKEYGRATGPHVTQEEIKKAIKIAKNNKATW